MLDMLKIENNIDDHWPCESWQTDDGITLVELLVTISILGIIALAFFSTFAIGMNAYARLRNDTTTRTDVLLSLEKMESSLRNIPAFSEIEFVGNSSRISFPGFIKSNDSENKNDLSLGCVSYYFDDQTGALKKQEEDYTEAISLSGYQANNTECLANIENIEFTYYYFNSEPKSYDEKNSMQEGGGVPFAVGITVSFKNGDMTEIVKRLVLIPIAQ